MTEPRGPHINGVPLREYVEARMTDVRDALETASDEREKAAQQLRDQQYRALEQAEREREKSATVMRLGLDRAIKEGDDRLREHIANQIMQIQGALDSAEKLALNRLSSANEGTAALRREMQLITEAAKEAILKAEDAQKDVNAKGDEFRGQLSDQATLFYPRREAEQRMADLDRRIEEARHERERQLEAQNTRVTLLERGNFGRERAEATTQRHEDRVQPWQLWIAGVLVVVVSVLSSVLTSQ